MSARHGAGVRKLAHAPFHGLHQEASGEWVAESDDPQFLVSCAEPLPEAGIYRVSAVLGGANVSKPCIYFDFGHGWSEATCVELARTADNLWSTVVELPSLAAQHRFDPSDRACVFTFEGLVLERVDEAAVLLSGLRAIAKENPARAAAMIEAVARDAAGSGMASACGRLLRGEVQWREAGDAYADWIERHDEITVEERATLRLQLGALLARPLLSLMLPIHDVSPSRLDDCVDALLAQVYPDWELLLACTPLQQDLAERLASRSSRIRVILSDHDGHTSLASLAAAANGKLAAWLSGAPVLPQHALFAFAHTHLMHQDARILYSDGDRLDVERRRVDPWFRPQWNHDLFLSTDFLAGVAMLDIDLMREAIAAAAGRGDIENVLLHGVAACEEAPLHIPMVLWHLPEEAQLAASPEQRLPALAEHLRAGGAGVRCEATRAGARIRWPLPDPVPKASLIVPTRDRVELLRVCVDSVLEKTTYPSFEVVIVDNQSTDPQTLAYLQQVGADARVRVLRHDAPFNYSAINNRAVEQVDGDLVVLLNNDLEVITPDWLQEMASHAMRPGVGAVGAMLYYPDDTIQHAGVVLGLGGVAGHVYSREPRGTEGIHGRAALVQNASAVTAACLAVRRDAFLEVGGLDEGLQVAFNDVDFCLRLLAHGYRNVWTPFAEFYHHESATRGAEDTPAKRARFVSEVERMHETWRESIADDPAYSPNLSLRHGAANVLAEPPRQGLRKWLAAVLAARSAEEGKR